MTSMRSPGPGGRLEEFGEFLILPVAGVDHRGSHVNGARRGIAGIEQLKLELDGDVLLGEDAAQRMDADFDPWAKA